ncbi:hypothetical protein FN846DRAFT_1023179 [Sphaerosporella brunnea]|uniref:Uncharacterized protein n=1 Tax=Sphaerosporella brunnea TaxID=1250544 RepID=A0A5J5EPJ2_9PEZI|nr:hypothetical protein FN846DRAFT_1023179 [Sphaerosporella brunnea]
MSTHHDSDATIDNPFPSNSSIEGRLFATPPMNAKNEVVVRPNTRDTEPEPESATRARPTALPGIDDRYSSMGLFLMRNPVPKLPEHGEDMVLGTRIAVEDWHEKLCLHGKALGIDDSGLVSLLKGRGLPEWFLPYIFPDEYVAGDEEYFKPSPSASSADSRNPPIRLPPLGSLAPNHSNTLAPLGLSAINPPQQPFGYDQMLEPEPQTALAESETPIQRVRASCLVTALGTPCPSPNDTGHECGWVFGRNGEPVGFHRQVELCWEQ